MRISAFFGRTIYLQKVNYLFGSTDGMTPVHVAAAWGRTNLLHLLLLNGGDPWLLDEEGKDAFDYAYQGHHSNSAELLNRFIKLDAKSSSQRDIIPKFKVTLDKVMLYNRNAILEYKADTDMQFAPTQSRQLKCATTQTSPRENGLPCHGVCDSLKKYTSNHVMNSNKTEAEAPVSKFNSVLADLMHHNVTLRRGKRKKCFRLNTFEEKDSVKQSETETCVSDKSLYDELQAVKLGEESKADPKKTQSLINGSKRSLTCGVKEWQLNSIIKGKSPSVSEMTLIDELKKWQATSIIKSAKSVDSTDKSLLDETEILPIANSKHTTQTDHFGDRSFIEELKERQADGFKNLKKPNCSNSLETPSNWMDELKERQAEGLKNNIKQLSLEASKTQLVTNEVMVQVNPVAPEEDQESIRDISTLLPTDHVREQTVIAVPNQLSEITLAMEPVLKRSRGKKIDSSNGAVDKATECISLSAEEVTCEPYQSHLPFDKLYGFTVQDTNAICKDILSDSEDAEESTPDKSISPRFIELDSLAPENIDEVTSTLHTVDVDLICVENLPVPFTETHQDVSGFQEISVCKTDPVIVEEVSAIAGVQCAEATEPAIVWEELNVDLLSECGSEGERLKNDGACSVSSKTSLLDKITKESKESKLISSEKVDDYSVQESNVLKGRISNRNEVEESMDKIWSILPSEETFHRHLIDLSDTRATSTKKQFLDLDDWMTMDWMDHDEPSHPNGLRFNGDNLIDSDEDVPQTWCHEQDKSLLTEDASKSIRSSAEYFTCSEGIQTLSRYPGGKPKVSKDLNLQNVTVTSLPNPSRENCANSLSFGMLKSAMGEDHFLSKIRSQQTSIEPILSTQVTQDTTASSISDTDSFVSVSEDYIYTDEEEGVVLLERRYLVPEPNLSSSDHGLSGNSSSMESGSYDTDTLRSELKRRGLDPGPIIPSTKRVYVKRLRRLARDPDTFPKNKPVYSAELERTLRTENWYLDLSIYEQLERQVALQFAEPDTTRRWRQGVVKSSFCYLLLDPRITCNLPCRTDTTPQPKIWSSFLEGIFYVGKGKRSRPYSHLYQAVSFWKTGATSSDHKIQRILDIWRDGVGVVCLHIFQNTIPVEAFTREAAMIDALMLRNLKNARLSEYYGIAATWPSHNKKLLGVYLLYKAMLIFLNEGERQLRPADIGTVC